MDDSNPRTYRVDQSGGKWFVVTERGKRLPSPSPRSIFSSDSLINNFLLTYNSPMFTSSKTHIDVDPLQLMEATLSQSSPQLAGSSLVSAPLDIRDVRC